MARQLVRPVTPLPRRSDDMNDLTDEDLKAALRAWIDTVMMYLK